MNVEELERRYEECLEPSGPIVAAFKLSELCGDMLAALQVQQAEMRSGLACLAENKEENARLRAVLKEIIQELSFEYHRPVLPTVTRLARKALEQT